MKRKTAVVLAGTWDVGTIAGAFGIYFLAKSFIPVITFCVLAIFIEIVFLRAWLTKSV